MKPTKNFCSNFLASLACGTALLLTSSAAAATYQWTNTAATASFVNPLNWTNTASPFGNGVPVAGDVANHNIAGAAAVIADGDSVAFTTADAFSGEFRITGGEVNGTTMRAVASNGVVAISGGTVNLANFQITGNYGKIAISGGNTTVTTDSRVAAANTVWEVSGGVLNLSKHTIGSANSGNTNNIMTVSGDAQVTQNQGSGGGANRELWIGGNNGGSGTLILKDNAVWTSSAANGSTDVIIARAGGGTQSPVGVLTIQDNANFFVQAGAAAAKVIRMADLSATSSGTLNLNGGNLSTIGIQRISGTATINANGGKITALADSVSFFRNFQGTGGANSINLLAGGLTFENGGYAVVITNVLSGAGGLTKTGFGLLTLSGGNTYTGPTVINSDTLRLTGGGSINTSSGITVENFATLELTNANNALFTTGAFTLNNGTVTADFSTTNLTVGTLATAGGANTINIVALPNVSTLPARVKLVKYTTAAPGLVDGNNVLTALNATLPTLGSPVGYLTNNVADKCIELVITSMIVTPVITQQPQPDSAYAGYFAHFAVGLEITNSPTYQWRKDGVALSSGGAFSGADSAVLRISNVSAAELGNYDVIVANASGSVTSSPAALTLRSPSGYEAAAVAAGPAALFMFEDLNDPASGTARAYDFAGDRDGTYGIAAQNGLYGIVGPTPGDGFPGFDNGNTAARFFGFTPNSHVALPELGLNTNTVTLTAWINPGFPAAFSGVVFSRGGSTVAGMNFTGSVDINGRRTLGYTWNNEAATYNWNSGIGPTSGVWSFVALVVTPTNATVYIFDATGVRASSLARAHVAQNFGVGTFIGEDPIGGGNRQVDATLDGVGIYGKSLTQSELETLYAAGSGVSTFAPLIWGQPASQTRYAGQNVSFTVGASGSQPLSYQWQQTDGVNYYNITDGGRFSGANSPTLTISNLTLGDATNLVVTVNNAYGAPVSDMVTLTVNPTFPAEDITMSVVQGNPQDWNTAAHWSDGLSATESAAAKPGSTYRILANAALRTPATGLSSTFPGNSLTIEGAGIFNATIPGSGMGALLLKGDNNCVVTIPKLVMNGGQIFSFMNSGWTVTLAGEVEVLANTPFFAAEDTAARTIHLSAKLTGNGNVEYRGYTGGGNFQPAWVSSLNVSGAANTYSGTWNVIIGTLVGSAPGALGTNTITVGAQGALQATYDINNPNAELILNGRLNLTRDHTFKAVTVNGTPLAAGTYTFAQLNAAYPANFPATWTGQPGALTETSASGSVTVIGSGATPIPLASVWNGSTLTLTWPAGWVLLEADNVLGPWTPNNSATSPFVVTPTEPKKFFCLQAQ
jgi:autotransporter-associated beta strand protein